MLNKATHDVVLYAPTYLKEEIKKHFHKIVDRAKLTEEELQISLDIVYSHIIFINDAILPFENYVNASRLVRDIDSDDVTFVALTEYLDEMLWTGDTQLYNGLKAKGFTQVVNFADLKKKYNLS
ncbi:MAG: PIN domain-containing protein [Bacteroidota bacterium]